MNSASFDDDSFVVVTNSKSQINYSLSWRQLITKKKQNPNQCVLMALKAYEWNYKQMFNVHSLPGRNKCKICEKSWSFFLFFVVICSWLQLKFTRLSCSDVVSIFLLAVPSTRSREVGRGIWCIGRVAVPTARSSHLSCQPTHAEESHWPTWSDRNQSL